MPAMMLCKPGRHVWGMCLSAASQLGMRQAYYGLLAADTPVGTPAATHGCVGVWQAQPPAGAVIG
jgi:hypothetical protein